jgi:hypothetical protein
VETAACAWRVRRRARLDRENGGLISADRKTSLLSRLQYPVSVKSSTVDLTPGARLVAIGCGAGAGPYRHSRDARVVSRRVPAWILA